MEADGGTIPEGEGGTQPEDDASPRRGRRISRRQFRIIIVVIVVAVVVTVLIWGMVPEPIYEVREAIKDLDELEGKVVSIKGDVISWEAGDANFTLADTNDANKTILVEHSGPIPEGFGVDVTVVVTGKLRRDGDTYRMDSEEVQVGCPSKY